MLHAFVFVFFFLFLNFSYQTAFSQERSYVGSKACSDCHPDEYENFNTYAKKATSSKSIKIMSDKLIEEEREECYGCHTTGYKKPGGFESFDKTPEMENAGCEVCHGPGSEHIETGDPDQIKGSLTLDDCTGCHNTERVNSFGFKPLIYGGAH